jgi:hypothetical protein
MAYRRPVAYGYGYHRYGYGYRHGYGYHRPGGYGHVSRRPGGYRGDFHRYSGFVVLLDVRRGMTSMRMFAYRSKLANLGLDGLRLAWRNIFGKVVPAHLSNHLLLRIVLRIVAYRLQANVYGDVERRSSDARAICPAEAWGSRRRNG